MGSCFLDISPKVNVIAQMEGELASFDSTVYYFNQFATLTPHYYYYYNYSSSSCSVSNKNTFVFPGFVSSSLPLTTCLH